MSDEDLNSQFEFDVHRSVILAHYIRFWGLPGTRYAVMLHDRSPLEVYGFPPENDGPHRFATVGASAKHPAESSCRQWELFLAVPAHLCGATDRSVLEFLADLAAYGIFDKVEYRRGVLMPDVPSVPLPWLTRTIALDMALCEPESFASVHVGPLHVDLLWVVLVHTAELTLIRERGMEELYTRCDKQGWHPTDPGRPPLG
jgi:hypothetical protein